MTFFDKHQSLKACIHETKSTCVELMLDNARTNRWKHVSQDLKC